MKTLTEFIVKKHQSAGSLFPWVLCYKFDEHGYHGIPIDFSESIVGEYISELEFLQKYSQIKKPDRQGRQ